MTPLLQRWKEFHRSFTHTPQAVKLVWQTNRWATIGLGFLTLVGALLPASQAWVGKLIVDGVVASIQRGAAPEQVRSVFVYLIIELALFLLSAGAQSSAATHPAIDPAPARQPHSRRDYPQGAELGSRFL